MGPYIIHSFVKIGLIVSLIFGFLTATARIELIFRLIRGILEVRKQEIAYRTE
ncbi:hypothetical protein EDD64_101206 [Effusibacillus lacus]|nr:hypothetical protein EDD64_101206 [Effusibacillus lacus]